MLYNGSDCLHGRGMRISNSSFKILFIVKRRRRIMLILMISITIDVPRQRRFLIRIIPSFIANDKRSTSLIDRCNNGNSMTIDTKYYSTTNYKCSNKREASIPVSCTPSIPLYHPVHHRLKRIHWYMASCLLLGI